MSVTVRQRPGTPAAARGSRTAYPEDLQWLAPAPLWDSDSLAGSSTLLAPWVAELDSDDFVDDFLGLLSGRHGASPAALADTRPSVTVGGQPDAPFRLFQPLSQRYYLVTASLVCRRPGIPDHAVARARGEQVGFVLRRLAADGSERAWVPAPRLSPASTATPGAPATGSWLPAPADDLVEGEERLPLHAAPVAGFAAAGTPAADLGMAADGEAHRTVCYGYVPVGRRERLIPALSDTEVLDRLAAINAENQGTVLPQIIPDLDAFVIRVVKPWQQLLTVKPPEAPEPADPPDPPPPAGFPATSTGYPWYPSLFVVLDLARYLQSCLPTVLAAIVAGGTVADPAGENLRQSLAAVTVPSSAGTVTLTAAVKTLVDGGYLPLVDGVTPDALGLAGGYTEPPRYDLTAATLPGGTDWLNRLKLTTGLYQRVRAALLSTPPTLRVPPELSGLIKDDPVEVVPGAGQPVYVIRTVYLHPPCRPVLSARSHPFVLARATDGDAPARKIRIPVPDISNLRGFQRGVALEMPPNVTRMINRVRPDMLKGEGLGADVGIQLGWICSFSIQIIFLCAFIVLFIFLILLNIVFWWLPFLRICFPVPVKRTSPKGPTP